MITSLVWKKCCFYILVFTAKLKLRLEKNLIQSRRNPIRSNNLNSEMHCKLIEPRYKKEGSFLLQNWASASMNRPQRQFWRFLCQIQGEKDGLFLVKNNSFSFSEEIIEMINYWVNHLLQIKCCCLVIRKAIWYLSNFQIFEILSNIYFDLFFYVQNWDSQQVRDSCLKINEYYTILRRFENLSHLK